VEERDHEAPPRAGLVPRIQGALRSLAQHLRAERWGLGVTLVTLVASLWIYAVTPMSWTPGADGFYSWTYARSLAFDGDIDFKNDYALCGDPFRIGVDRGTGHPDNIFYFGPAVVWTPVLWILRLGLRGLPPSATCGRPFSTITLGLSPVMAALTAYLCYRLARRHFSDGVAALAVALVVVGGPVLRLATCLPSYSHTADALFVSALLVLTARAVESPSQRRRWAWVALSLSACVWQRLSNAAFAVVPLVALVIPAHALSSRWRELVVPVAAVGAGTLAGLGVYGIVYRYLYGSPFVFTHGRYFLQLAHAHPFLLLFDEAQGLFYCTPSIWLAVLGLVPALRDRPARRLVAPLFAIAILEIYLSSAALDWAPSRRLANLAPLWVLATCFTLRAFAARVPWRSRGLSVAGMVLASPFCVASLGDAWGASRGLVPGSTNVVGVMNGTLGTLGALPAEIVFSLRYRLPRDRFSEATAPVWYARDFRSLAWIRRDLPFTDARIARLAEGFSPAAGGARPIGPRARLVFAAQWPFATHIKVRAGGSEGVRLRIGEGRAWGEPRWFGAAQALPATPGDVTFAVPPGEFSSGIHEIVFDFSGDELRAATVVSLSLDDRAPRPPAFQR
jgi:hypothetical protein